MRLRPHSDWPPQISQLDVVADLRWGPSMIEYRIDGGSPLIPLPRSSGRIDGLWQTTCFELFVRPVAGEAYFEFNFSPSTQWAAYRFDRYREGMAELPLPTPVIERLPDGVRVSVDLGGLPAGPWRVGITAVIEERDGTKSYWSLAHPDAKPDFHHADGFVLEVPT